MGFGSIQGMIASLKNNRIQKSDRKKLFENKDGGRSGIYGPMRDHKKMSEYQRSVFMRKLQENKRRERKRNALVWGISLVITALVDWGVPKLLQLL